MTQIKIDYFELPAADFDATQRFYEKAFGWTFADYGPEYRAFNDGKFNGGLYKSDKHSSTKTGATLVVLVSDNLETTLDAVKVAGGKIVVDIFSFPGGQRFQFTDPNGNELAVWTKA